MSEAASSTSGRTTIVLADGIAEGSVEAGVRRFLSLPYAAPVTAERRFREPQAVQPWAGVRDATAPGASAPQNSARLPGIDMDSVMGSSGLQGPDYLTLNVWAPMQGAAGLPVMVFVHGGGFIAGGKDAPAYDGASFARDGVVCVSVNYRLGIEGFLPIPGAPTNLGLRDIIAALRWVAANIASFGGDAANVTLFGESAGASCVALLTISPAARGLFKRAICQSGHANLCRDVASLQPIVRRLARRLRVTPDRDGFAGASVEATLKAQAWVAGPSLALDLGGARTVDLSMGARFAPVVGDDIVPEPPLAALAGGAGEAIDLLTGATSEEANLFFAPGGMLGRMSGWQAILMMRRAVARPRALLRDYGLGRGGARAGQVLSRAFTDLMFRAMSRRNAELHRGRAWVYEFDWRSPALGGTLGAAHAVELPFVFDTLATASGADGLLGPQPPQDLADSIHALWTRFATEGVLPWPPYEPATRMVYSLTRGLAEQEPLTPAAARLS
jgi:para-nitrobenzyl esterase